MLGYVIVTLGALMLFGLVTAFPAHAHCVTSMGPCIDRAQVAVELVTPYVVLGSVATGAMVIFWRFIR